jgi:Spy/CpxP family protein refolding chaperone
MNLPCNQSADIASWLMNGHRPGGDKPAGTGKRKSMKLCRVSMSLVAGAALGGFLAFTSVSSAQNTNATERAGRRGPTVEQRVERITTELKLNDDQKAKVVGLFKKQAKERREIVADKDMARPERREKMRALAEEQNKQFKTILTSEQFEKWQALRAQMRANRQRNPGQAGEPAAAPAPPPIAAPTPNGGNGQSQ